jgi:hypothetical protein
LVPTREALPADIANAIRSNATRRATIDRQPPELVRRFESCWAHQLNPLMKLLPKITMSVAAYPYVPYNT